MGGISKTEQGEESALVRLLLLSFRCCMLQRQEGVLKGGVWKKRRKGEKGSAWAALQQLQQQPVRAKEERKTRLEDCLRGNIFLHGFARKRD